jgi:glycosyltransferase involved in cell wall biosynthesis
VKRVGVVIPSYNHAAYVGEAVRSVLSQTIDGVSLVVVDDGSTDNSPDVVRAAFESFPGRDTTLIVQDNAGAHAAIARGIETLDTPACAVLNSDDVYETNRFETMLPHLGNADHAIAFSALRLIDAEGSILPPDHAWARWYATALTAAETEPTIGFALLVHNFSVTSGNFVFTRALYDRLGGFGNQKFAHDWDFLIRAVALTEPVFVREKLMRYRVHGSNTTESVRGLLEEECNTTLDRYARMMRGSQTQNAEAPCGALWPDYWPKFGSRKLFFSSGNRADRSGWHASLRAD